MFTNGESFNIRANKWHLNQQMTQGSK